jgi:nitroreductase
MDADEAMVSRASVRSYKDSKVDDGLIREMLSMATQAPSSGNTQEWVFVVVKKKENRAKLAEAYVIDRKFQFDAPAIIVVCADIDAIEAKYGERGVLLYAAQDTAAAIENLMLAATERGLATCWIGAFNEQVVRNAIAAPQRIRPMAMITLGYAKAPCQKPARKPLAEVAYSETYGNPLK